MAIEKITLETLQKNLIDEFLTWLETQRGCSVSTRNQRLAAIHAFFRYLQLEEPGHLFLCQQILAIPMKRSASKAINYLTLDAMKAILEAPDTTCLMGRRDLVLLSLMYDDCFILNSFRKWSRHIVFGTVRRCIFYSPE